MNSIVVKTWVSGLRDYPHESLEAWLNDVAKKEPHLSLITVLQRPGPLAFPGQPTYEAIYVDYQRVAER